jgi:hypothetical protein
MRMEGQPVVMLSHGFANIGSEPIAKVLWLKKGEFKGNKGIQAKTQFFPDELGARLWKKNVEGYMPNWSVGWRPLKHEYLTDRKTGAEIRHVYEWELLEYSLVSAPMQPDAQTPAGQEGGQLRFKVLNLKQALPNLTVTIPDEQIKRIINDTIRKEINKAKGRVE